MQKFTSGRNADLSSNLICLQYKLVFDQALQSNHIRKLRETGIIS